jgi:hypothetical protein
MITKKIYSTLPRDITEPGELKGDTVEHEGKKYEIVNTELFMHSPPWKKGEKCGFVVKASP